jgi:hypothetical protein
VQSQLSQIRIHTSTVLCKSDKHRWQLDVIEKTNGKKETKGENNNNTPTLTWGGELLENCVISHAKDRKLDNKLLFNI